MKRRAILAAMISAGLACGMAEAQAAAPAVPTQAGKAVTHKISTEPARLDLGWMRPSTTKDGTVRLVNTSEDVVNILRVTSSCTCTVGKLTDDQKILRPGDSTELTVSLKSGANTGPMAQRAYVWYEGSRSPYELFVLAEVSHPVKTDPTFVNLLGSSKEGMIRLESLDGAPFRVTSVDGAEPKVFDLDEKPVDPKEPRTSYLVKFDYTGVADEDLDRWFMIETDHPEAQELPLRVLHRSLYQVNAEQPTWSFGTDRFILGRMTAGDSLEREVTLKAVTNPTTITGVRVDNPGLDAEIIETRRDGRNVVAKIRFKATGGETGLIKTKVLITAKDQEQGADVIARVEAGS